MAVLGPVRLRQDDAAAADRRLRAARRRPHRGRRRELAGPDASSRPRSGGWASSSRTTRCSRTCAWRRTWRSGSRAAPREERDALTRRTLELVGLQHKAANAPARALRRRAPARGPRPRARARPELILLDEPFSSLDATLRAGLRREVELILRDAGATALLVTHDQEEALSLADRAGGDARRPDRPGGRARRRSTGARPTAGRPVRGRGERAGGRGARRRGGDRARRLRRGRAPASGSVHVAVRPEQLLLRADGNGNAEVVAREFRGHDVLYRLRHEGGRRRCWCSCPRSSCTRWATACSCGPAPAAVTCLVD